MILIDTKFFTEITVEFYVLGDKKRTCDVHLPFPTSYNTFFHRHHLLPQYPIFTILFFATFLERFYDKKSAPVVLLLPGGTSASSSSFA